MPLNGAVDLTYALPTANAPVESPKWWLQTLSSRLESRRPDLEEWDAYYEGEHPLLFATPKFREAFGDLFQAFADNWCEVVVDASAERLTVEGFRLADSEDDSDEDAWELWQRNGLDAESSSAMLEAIKLSESYVIVEPVADDVPRITVEHPSQVIVATDAGDRRRRLAALKKWQDDYGYVYATVYLPDGAYRFRTDKPADLGAFDATFVERPDAYSFVPYGRVFGGQVPVVPIVNNPSMLRGGRSDLKKVIPLQNAINKLASDLIIASEFAAFRQRVLTGVEIPRYPEGHAQAGEPMNEAYIAAVSRVWAVEEPDARVQEFSASDLTNYVKAVEMFVQHLAAQTRTPPHYLMGTVVNASGDALKAAETGLVSKARGKSRHFGEGWEDTTRLGLLAWGKRDKAEAKTIETLWGDFESRSLAEVTDAAVKMRDLEVPVEALWERIGATAAERERWATLREKERNDLLAQALAGTTTAPGDQGLPTETTPAATPPAQGV